MNDNLELLRRIDEKDYLTEREHREFLKRLRKSLKALEILKKNAYVYEDEIDIEITDENEHFEEIKEALK